MMMDARLDTVDTGNTLGQVGRRVRIAVELPYVVADSSHHSVLQHRYIVEEPAYLVQRLSSTVAE